MSTQASIQYSGPVIDPSVPWEISRHLQKMYTDLGNHTVAFGLVKAEIDKLSPGTSTTTVIAGGGGGSGGGGSTPVAGIPVNNQSGQTSYTTIQGDNGALVVFSDAGAIAVSLSTQTPPYGLYVTNLGALGSGTVTLTPATGTINGAATLSVLPTYGALIAFDGTLWWALTMPVVPVAIAKVTHEWLDSYNASTGDFTQSQPSYSDLTGTPILPANTPAVAHEWLASYDSTTGDFTQTQPAFTDLSGSLAEDQLPADVPVVSFGTGAPSGASTEGFVYFDTTLATYAGYVYHSGAWNPF